ncbi:alpha beta hydrolase fold-3 domain-containing protein [Amylocarpus encephaloides]|uniref:Alpha beta hydrolase fold-3 domain-containing protein n=1 Tax=Amylocarpus encephaloides TaxID=45428 RepID=A0A9P7Y5S7_9HELO|nr:alpha beta hydrolase fold-3 domain-containing protein [Amylocarpus encephaloides]
MMNNQPLVNALHPSVVDRLDPQFAAIYNEYQAPRLRADQVSYEEYNKDRAKYTISICPGPSPEVGDVKIFKVPVSDPEGEILVQVFFPTEEAIVQGGLRSEDRKLPAHINHHGGGFVIGNLKTDESWCRQICQSLGCIVINVDYRLSPEYPHPIPLTDSWAALKWTFASAAKLAIDFSRVSVGGLSAGGQLAAVLALLSRDDPSVPKLVLQILTVPVTDARHIPLEGPSSQDDPYESHKTNEFAPFLPLHRICWFYRLWLGNDMDLRQKTTQDFKASPILASSHANLARASIHVAEVDSIASEGIAYHEKLKKAGNQSSLKIYEGCGHLFPAMDGELEKAKVYVKNTIIDLREAYKLP